MKSQHFNSHRFFCRHWEITCCCIKYKCEVSKSFSSILLWLPGSKTKLYGVVIAFIEGTHLQCFQATFHHQRFIILWQTSYSVNDFTSWHGRSLSIVINFLYFERSPICHIPICKYGNFPKLVMFQQKENYTK